jgi:hypothetical protein
MNLNYRGDLFVVSAMLSLCKYFCDFNIADSQQMATAKLTMSNTNLQTHGHVSRHNQVYPLEVNG